MRMPPAVVFPLIQCVSAQDNSNYRVVIKEEGGGEEEIRVRRWRSIPAAGSPLRPRDTR
jgi:hypothetical protein